MITRLWGIRHVRWAWLSWRFSSWWRRVGQFVGLIPNPADIKYLERVWRGDA